MLIKDFFKDREILFKEEMLIKDFFKDREILLQEEMLIKNQGQGNLASGRDADKKSRTGKSCFRKRC